MVFARSSGGTSTTDEETQEAEQKQDISVFPLATPLIAGPGAMGAVILLMANAEGDWKTQATIIACLVAVLDHHRWKVAGKGGAAEFLGLHPATLNSRLKALGIERPRATRGS